MLRRVALLLAICMATLAALGELAPEVYAALRREAPEVLYVEVIGVDVDRDLHKPPGCGFWELEVERHVTVQAKVLRVVRSRTGVRAGRRLSVRYRSLRRCSGFSGPRSIPVLDEGTKTYAYLTKVGRRFSPAARGASFATDLRE